MKKFLQLLALGLLTSRAIPSPIPVYQDSITGKAGVIKPLDFTPGKLTIGGVALYPVNDASGFVKLDLSGRYPAADGSLILGITKAQIGLSSVGNFLAEPALGNPPSNGMVLSSTSAGVRSWIAPGGGGGGGGISDFVFTNGSGITGVVTNHTTTPTLSLSINDNSIGLEKLSVAPTGTGSIVLNTAPLLITPSLGVASATSINGLTITTGTGVLSIASGKILTLSNTLTFSGTDGANLVIGGGGTLGSAAYTATSAYATAAQGTKADAAGAITGIVKSNGSSTFSAATQADFLPTQTGNSGKYLTTNGTTPSWTNSFGNALVTTLNGNTFTTGTGTLTLGAGKTATISNTLTLAGTDGSTLNIGTGGTLGTAAYTASSTYDAAGAAAAVTKTSLGIPNVENTALSTWTGSTNLSTFGTGSVDLSEMANMATASFLGRNTAGTGAPEVLSIAMTKTMLGLTGTNGGDQNIFQTVSVSGQSDVVADSTTDVLTLAAGSGVTLTTNASTDTVTISATTGGGGTVTTFSAGNLSPLFTSSVATATTTPALTFALSTAGANTFFGNGTGSTAAPAFMSAATALTALGGTTAGTNLFTLPNPSAISYPRINADNTVTARSLSNLKTDLSLNLVENTALSTWGGSATIATLGTITTGTWHGTTIADTYISSAATWNAKSPPLVPTTVKTASYTLAASDFVPVDLTGGNVPLTLPTAPTDGARVGIKIVAITPGNSTTFTCGGSDVINIAGTTSGTLSLLNQAVVLQYKSLPAIWYVTSSDLPKSQLDTLYQANTGKTITLGGNLTTSGSFNLTETLTGTTNVTFPTSGTLATVDGALGTPTSLVGTNITGLPVSTGVSGLATGVATFLGTSSSANLAAALTDETGTGADVFGVSPTITTPNIVGTSTNNAASAGSVGEEVRSLIPVGSAVSLTTATTANITSISLTAGDWDVRGIATITTTGVTTTGQTTAGITATSVTLPTDGTEVTSGVKPAAAAQKDSLTFPGLRFSLSTTTTIYLVIQTGFSAGTESAYGYLSARRIR